MQPLPLHLDLFALVILLGVAQGVFLGLFFLTGTRRSHLANHFVGWLMLALSAVIGEIFLGYSNYMARIPAWVDVSEPLNFVMGPLFFLFVAARVRAARTWDQLPHWWALHFIPAELWTINAVSWLYQPIELKYNNFLEAWHPELPPVAEPAGYLPEDFFGLRDYINELTLASCLLYSVLALLMIYRSYRAQTQSFWRGSGQIGVLRTLALLFLAVPLLIVIVKPQFTRDLGDYILACYLSGVIYTTSFLVMRGSTFFPALPVASPEPLAEARKKYEKSALSPEVEEAVLTRLTQLLATEKPYLSSTLSLPALAAQLGTSPHHLSQLLNNRLGLTFFDWLATQRIAEARQLLSDPATAYLKIDEIAERVGYNSPSAFHTAFKRLTSQTPAQFRAGRLV